MQMKTHVSVLLAAALAFTMNLAAQHPEAISPHAVQVSTAVELNFERAQVAQTGTPSFWLKGGAANVSMTFWRGFGVAANLTGEHTANIRNGVSLSKIAFMVGPRYTFEATHHVPRMLEKHRTMLFGESLFGPAHAFDSAFPARGGLVSSATALSVQTGGGVDVGVTKGFGVRALEMDWVHTSLPNNAGDSQNDFRIAFGVSYRR